MPGAEPRAARRTARATTADGTGVRRARASTHDTSQSDDTATASFSATAVLTCWLLPQNHAHGKLTVVRRSSVGATHPTLELTFYVTGRPVICVPFRPTHQHAHQPGSLTLSLTSQSHHTPHTTHTHRSPHSPRSPRPRRFSRFESALDPIRRICVWHISELPCAHLIYHTIQSRVGNVTYAQAIPIAAALYANTLRAVSQPHYIGSRLIVNN